jgi:hypothetical protein
MRSQRWHARLHEPGRFPPEGEELNSNVNEKLSPDAKQLFRGAARGRGVPPEARGKTDVLVRTTQEVSSDDRARLESLGATIRTVAGDVLTARIPVDRLNDLAELDVVVYVEISRPLMQEGRRSAEQRPTAGEE